MASKKIEKGTEEFQFFKELFMFRQQFYSADNQEWFETTLVPSADKFIAKYENTEIEDFVRQMVLTLIEDVDKRFRSEQENGKKET